VYTQLCKTLTPPGIENPSLIAKVHFNGLIPKNV
jgi:hypothetical protein